MKAEAQPMGIHPQKSRGQVSGDQFGDRNKRKKKEKIKMAWKVKLHDKALR